MQQSDFHSFHFRGKRGRETIEQPKGIIMGERELISLAKNDQSQLGSATARDKNLDKENIKTQVNRSSTGTW